MTFQRHAGFSEYSCLTILNSCLLESQMQLSHAQIVQSSIDVKFYFKIPVPIAWQSSLRDIYRLSSRRCQTMGGYQSQYQSPYSMAVGFGGYLSTVINTQPNDMRVLVSVSISLQQAVGFAEYLQTVINTRSNDARVSISHTRVPTLCVSYTYLLRVFIGSLDLLCPCVSCLSDNFGFAVRHSTEKHLC